MSYIELLKKYDIPSPRYTSYPTVPFWDEATCSTEKWEQELASQFADHNQNSGISIYIHLPYCEQLCTYCGCNKRITVNHEVESPYIEALLKEWDMYLKILAHTPVIREIHLGGGTPTFFTPDNLKYLIDNILKRTEVAPEYEFSFEVHPNYTRKEHLQTLYNLGFRRLSVGIQDFDPKVQHIINRPQSFEKTREVFDEARRIGYTSINADIIYGLPIQQEQSVKSTIEKVKELKPERIAFYSYAHVPWKSRSQRRYTEEDLPTAEQKRKLYELGRNMLQEAGYKELGMDHFALPEDSLYKAMENGSMHRNFMGYTVQKTKISIGLGASSIGDTGTAFIQNIKDVEEYQDVVSKGQLPIKRGHLLTKEDIKIRQHIMNLMCKQETTWDKEELEREAFRNSIERAKELIADDLLRIKNNTLTVTEAGKPFIRNICMCFDERIRVQQPTTVPVFSRSI